MAKGGRGFRRGVQAYISQVLAHPRLTPSQEVELFNLWWRERSAQAKSTILTANLRHVVAMALGYRCYPVDIEDLISEGNLGLLVAFDKFDASRGTRFITYATYWIRAFMLNLIIRTSYGDRTGAGPFRSKLFFKLRRERAKSLCLLGECEAVYTDLAKKMQVSADKVCGMATALEAADLSIDGPIKSGSSVTLMDWLQDAGPTPEDFATQTEREKLMRKIINLAMESLDRREQYVISKRMLGEERASLAEVGRELGVSRERARQIEGRAKRKIRASLESSGYHSFSTIS